MRVISMLATWCTVVVAQRVGQVGSVGWSVELATRAARSGVSLGLQSSWEKSQSDFPGCSGQAGVHLFTMPQPLAFYA